ncbi:MAG: murein biosynthesis integral membrane protein MurJ [Gammaproteobacteria bacterium]|nr:murein biosynthesis integral membrane protein MurJ [Gammaproteobacteria bacterium]
MSSSLLKSTGVVGAMTLISRVLGFLREVLQAVLFGAGGAVDAFLVAYKIPNFMRRLFAEGAFSQAFVPVLSETKSTRSPAEVKELVDVVAGTLGGVLAGLTLIGIAIAPLIMWAFAPGFHAVPGKFDTAVELLRWTFPFLLFISLTAFASGVLNSHGQFAVPAFTPVILNLCLIAAMAFAPSVHALAVAVLVGGLLQLAFQLPSLARLGLLPRPRWGWADPQVRRIIGLMVPIIFSSSVAQISLLLDTILASFLADGSVSWLWYADRLMELPLGTFTIAVATVILPALSAQHAAKSPEKFSATLDWGLRAILAIGLPACVGLFLLAGPMLSALFQYNAFDAHDVRMTAWPLMAYALGFLGFSFVKVLVPGYYARMETKAPVRYGIIALLSGMGLSLAFVGSMLWLGFEAPHAGLALATAGSAWINSGLLYFGLRREGIYRPAPGWGAYLGRLLLANAVMAAVILGMAGALDTWTAAPGSERIARLAAAIAAAVSAYFATLFASGLRLRHFRH